MPKNKGSGGKAHRKGKKAPDGEKRELEFKQDGMEYGQIVKVMGGGRFEIVDGSGKKRIGHVRGSMFKRVWINAGDIVLISLRDYQDGKCDIMLKYMPDEIRTLRAYGELTGQLGVDIQDENNDISFASKNHVDDDQPANNFLDEETASDDESASDD